MARSAGCVLCSPRYWTIDGRGEWFDPLTGKEMDVPVDGAVVPQDTLEESERYVLYVEWVQRCRCVQHLARANCHIGMRLCCMG